MKNTDEATPRATTLAPPRTIVLRHEAAEGRELAEFDLWLSDQLTQLEARFADFQTRQSFTVSLGR